MSDPSYSTRDPKGFCGDPKRGAAMGRPTYEGVPEGEITLRRVVIDQDGYDFNGTYWGHGPYLFWYADAEHNVDATFRASKYEDALEIVQKKYPNSTIRKAEALQPACYGPEDEACFKHATEDSEFCEDHDHLAYEEEEGE